MLIVRGTKKLRDRLKAPPATAADSSTTVLGVMNEFAYLGERRWHSGSQGLEDISLQLAGMFLGPLRERTGSPDRELASVIGPDPTNALPFRSRTAASAPARDATVVYQLKVTLQGTKPPIWRRIMIDRAASLHDVHEVIQAAFGWWNYHLYDFEVGRARYGIPDPDWDLGPPTTDARRTRFDKVATVGNSLMYTYDFGDSWEHKVVVEKIVDSADVVVPACIDGRRAGPPEDCGGVWGYAELLRIIADPSHPEHTERLEWLEGMSDGPVDPEAFDPNEFADNLRMLRLAALD